MLLDFPKQGILGCLVIILWVMTPRKRHGLWPTGDLWVIPPIPTPDGPKSMGYQVLWVTRTYRLRGLRLYTVYIYPAACSHLSPQCDHISAFALIYAGFSLRRREVSSRHARRGSLGRRGTPFWWELEQRRTLLVVGWLRSPRACLERVF